jgi:hypothetical protein
MPAFAVLEPPGHSDMASGHADRFVFLNEKFSFNAFLFGPVWMIWRKLWLEMLAYVAGLAVIGVGLYALGIGWPAIIVILLLIQLLLGLEAASLVRERLIRRGWRDSGVVIADDLDLAERRFFDDRFAHRAARTASMPPPLPFAGAPIGPARPDVVGLFPEPKGGR